MNVVQQKTKNKPVKGKGAQKEIQNENRRTDYHYQTSLKVMRNEPLYIYTDNAEPEYLHMNFQIFGHKDLLKKISEEESLCKTLQAHNICNVRTCPELLKICNELYIDTSTHALGKRPLARLVITNYNWCDNVTGDLVLMGVTLGEQGYTIEVPAG